MGALNVQVILEPLGGGGHLMMAGAQLQNCTLQDAEHRIREQSTFTARRKRKILRGNCDKNFGRETLMKIILKQDVKTIGKKTRSTRFRTATPATSCSRATWQPPRMPQR